MKKIILAALVLTLCITASALDYGHLYDDADLFSESEETEILWYAEAVYENCGLLTVVLTDYGVGDVLSMLPAYAGSATDMLMLTVDMSAREFELYQYNAYEGESAFRISQSESDLILDGILTEMANGDYAMAAVEFIKLSEEYFSNTEDFYIDDANDDYEYIGYETEEEENPLLSVFIGLAVGAAVGGITVLCVRGSYKKKVHGAIYPLGDYAKLELAERQDNFITKNVIVTRIPDPPQNSGGGRGGFGGGRSGGGGARMGGRSF